MHLSTHFLFDLPLDDSPWSPSSFNINAPGSTTRPSYTCTRTYDMCACVSMFTCSCTRVCFPACNSIHIGVTRSHPLFPDAEWLVSTHMQRERERESEKDSYVNRRAKMTYPQMYGMRWRIHSSQCVCSCCRRERLSEPVYARLCGIEFQCPSLPLSLSPSLSFSLSLSLFTSLSLTASAVHCVAPITIACGHTSVSKLFISADRPVAADTRKQSCANTHAEYYMRRLHTRAFAHTHTHKL